VEWNRKAGQNQHRVVAPSEEEEKEENICWPTRSLIVLKLCGFDLIWLSEYRGLFLTFIGSCILIYSYSTTNKIHLLSQIIYSCKTLYMFRTVFPSIIRSSILRIQQRYMSNKQLLLPGAIAAGSTSCLWRERTYIILCYVLKHIYRSRPVTGQPVCATFRSSFW
jgi:hypothetical protein